ncbi:orotidine-5'-phosphate decarboxylase [Psychromonas algicola]|uniref:orotidine-5'-phosphate decarboxylase n=1 Tax=Psychromonas algicola TaxID=2555642 RepID=UPI00106830D9|nr:orotidine-5'-phosphate decarboxylase [Psychromonas sp. RZ5]TEW44079.1 orotidine-5'-phosphate decarboxylase [Psychromonas sp. RZ5]
MGFIEKLEKSWKLSHSLLCVGLDPDINKIPLHLRNQKDALFIFNKAIIDSTFDLVCAFKPQIAYFASQAAEQQLYKTITYLKSNYPHIPIILDAKRGDIGSTATHYAVEAFERYGADAVTINPYMGFDSAEPFLKYRDKGAIFLCRTSNKGAADFQDLLVDGRPLYEKVATMISEKWNYNKNCLLVVGATWPDQIQNIRSINGDMPFLVPGVGTQGGNIKEIVEAGQTKNGTGLIISSSRAIIYAGQDEQFAFSARKSAEHFKEQINLHRLHNE